MAFLDMAGIGIENDERVQFNNFQEAFDKYDGRVLLLGEPGAGKTTTLFAFARDAVAARLVNPALPLPILAPIATWNAKAQTPLVDWLSSQIPLLKPDDLADLIDSGNVLLLLDGLDELGGEREENISGKYFNPSPKSNDEVLTEDDTNSRTLLRYNPRSRFINIIPANNRIAVTCRRQDYADIGQKPLLKGAITLQPLNDDQMQDYLHDLPDLWTVIEADSDLREVARTPLLLSLFTYAFRELPQETQLLRELKAGDVRDKIFELYVKRRYEHEKRKLYADLPFTLQQIKEILGQVAMETLGYWYLDDFLPLEVFETIMGYEKTVGFCKLAIHLHFLLDITIKDDESEEVFKGYRFIHLLLRDYFAFEYALSNLNDKTRYTQLSQVITTPVQALGTLRDSRAVEPLIELLHSSDQFMSDQVVNALTNIGEKSIVPLLGVLKHSNDRVRRYAIEALGKIGDQRVVEQFIDLLKDRSIYIRVSAVTALGNLKDLRAVEPLCFLLEDEHDLVRISAAIALSKLNDLRAVDPFIAALDYDNPSMRYRAALGLGLLRSEKAVKPLISHLTDMGIASIFFQDRVQDGVAEALKRIGTPESLAAVEGWRKSQHKGEN